MIFSPPYCSNQQSTNQPAAITPVEGAILFYFFVACNALCKPKAESLIRKGQKLLKTVHF